MELLQLAGPLCVTVTQTSGRQTFLITHPYVSKDNYHASPI